MEKNQNDQATGTAKRNNPESTVAVVVTTTCDSRSTSTHSNVNFVRKQLPYEDLETSDDFPFTYEEGYACTHLNRRRGEKDEPYEARMVVKRTEYEAMEAKQRRRKRRKPGRNLRSNLANSRQG